MAVKKRPKMSRHRGTHTHGRGAKKKARGKGHRGGIGNAGTGKRADQKKTKVTKSHGGSYFGKSKVRRAQPKIVLKAITLRTITETISTLVKEGKAKEKNGAYELQLETYKIIGNTPINMKLHITARAATKGAQTAVETAGGTITLTAKKTDSETEKPAATTNDTA